MLHVKGTRLRRFLSLQLRDRNVNVSVVQAPGISAELSITGMLGYKVFALVEHSPEL